MIENWMRGCWNFDARKWNTTWTNGSSSTFPLKTNTISRIFVAKESSFHANWYRFWGRTICAPCIHDMNIEDWMIYESKNYEIVLQHVDMHILCTKMYIVSINSTSKWLQPITDIMSVEWNLIWKKYVIIKCNDYYELLWKTKTKWD